MVGLELNIVKIVIFKAFAYFFPPSSSLENKMTVRCHGLKGLKGFWWSHQGSEKTRALRGLPFGHFCFIIRDSDLFWIIERSVVDVVPCHHPACLLSSEFCLHAPNRTFISELCPTELTGALSDSRKCMSDDAGCHWLSDIYWKSVLKLTVQKSGNQPVFTSKQC